MTTLLACAAAHAAQPTDEQIQAALDDFAALNESVRTFEQFEAAMAEFAGKHPEVLALDELDARTIERLLPILTASQGQARDVLARLARIEAPDTVDGAVAMVYASYFDTRLERRLPEPARLASIMGHPRLIDALEGGHGAAVFELLAYFGEFRPDDLAPVRAEVLGLASVMTPASPVEIALSGMDYLLAIDGLLGDSDEDMAERERIRGRVAAALRGARTGVDAEAEPVLAEMLDDAVLRTDGAFARGELVGHEAPELDFLWASDVELLGGARTLSDLRGRVVILDFWHTECPQCIRTFPKVRALAKQYEAAPVVVLGVTSVRGRHGDPEKGVIDTSGSPESEFALMRDYVGKMNITWPVVFTAQSLYNPEYGVEATPHVAIVDPAGVVRHRALHPEMPMIETIEKIDAILTEFGMPVPKTPGSTGREETDVEEPDAHDHDGDDHDGDDHDGADHDGADHPDGDG